jgi:putative DNA-invertase from lambdoid prophage Rac
MGFAAQRLTGRRMRRGAAIPRELVKRLLGMGLSKKDVYRLLVAQGYLRYREKGEEKTITYEQFLRRLKKEALVEHVA